MPVYLHVINLIIQKESIIQKYKGGLQQFKKDFNFDNSELNQEDDELISFGQMNFDGLFIDAAIAGGLDFDVEKQFSQDFTLLYRYGDMYWNVDWLVNNSVFAWHIDTNPKLIDRANEISSLTMDKIAEEMDMGNNLFDTIRMK